MFSSDHKQLGMCDQKLLYTGKHWGEQQVRLKKDIEGTIYTTKTTRQFQRYGFEFLKVKV